MVIELAEDRMGDAAPATVPAQATATATAPADDAESGVPAQPAAARAPAAEMPAPATPIPSPAGGTVPIVARSVAQPVPATMPVRVAPPPPAAAAASPRAATSAAASSSAQSGGDWEQHVLAELARRKRYPAPARRAGMEDTVYVRIRVDRSGRVLSSAVAQSHRLDPLDAAALDLVRRTAPLPPPPPSVAGAEVEFVVPLTYSLAEARR